LAISFSIQRRASGGADLICSAENVKLVMHSLLFVCINDRAIFEPLFAEFDRSLIPFQILRQKSHESIASGRFGPEARTHFTTAARSAAPKRHSSRSQAA
jgi:hypothetical protein